MLSDNKPLYSQILGILRERISQGEYVTGQQLPTELELADKFGVSRITSKRALIELEREGLIYRRRGSGSFVKKRDEAKKPAEVPIKPSSSMIISMVLPFVSPNNSLEHMQSVAKYLESKGYYLSIHNSNWNIERERELLISLPKRGTAGIILYPVSTQHNLDVVHALHMNDYPIVTLDQYYNLLTMGSAVSDNADGGYIAASKLIELGHTRIAFISTVGIQYRSTVRDRFFGYSKALNDNGIPLDIELCFSNLPSDAEGAGPARREFYKKLVGQLQELNVTAIQAEHDMVALDCLKAALDLGIKVPEELSIIGFDNNELCEQAEVPISTLEQNYEEIGRRSAMMIVDQLENGAIQQERAVIPVKWVSRQSVGPGPELHERNE
ncbi:substrate-binding domain-containing protein [Paenibacillus sp. OV219]|uniref:GntR family transcriptional regulator n=1 Tax=Paenibacillus sp. OV219 TaxID=1884377 RepID=UPI0008C599BE|nr:GntR family transcriptional regulator [Paenibacillus sp. OV219]SEM72221.1 GntR family transcriptional regulator, arabinose operon transcriptional repressor [Paenibacillus sp. OV219]